MTEKQPRHGGARAGAGRKPTPAHLRKQTYSFSLLPSQFDYLKALGNGNASEGLRIVTREHQERHRLP